MAPKTNKITKSGVSLRSCLEVSFPPATLHLLKELVQPEPNFDEIAKTISLDPGLTTTVLGLVNSPFYGLSQQVTDLKKAAVVIGTRELLKTTLSASFISNMISMSPGEDSFPTWRVMIWSAIASELIAERIDPKEKSQVYVCALLKDLSLLLMRSTCHFRMPDCLQGRVLNCLQQGQMKEELEIWGLNHPELTLEILSELGIKGLDCSAIAQHHDMDKLDLMSTQARALALGTRWSELAAGCEADPQSLLRFDSLLKTALNMSNKELNDFRNRLLDKYRSMIKTLGIEEADPDQRLYELSIQDMQKYYFQSMDLLNITGGPEGAAETLSRHLRWNFGVADIEVLLRDPLSERMFLFKCDQEGVHQKNGPITASKIEWKASGKDFKISTGKVFWGMLRLREELPADRRNELGIYVRFAAQAYEQYCLRRSVLEMKAHTLDNLPVGVARLDAGGRTLQINGRLAEFLGVSPEEKDVLRLLPVSRFLGAEQEWNTFLANDKKRDFSRIFCAEGVLEGDPKDKDRCLYISASKREVSGLKEILLLVQDVTEVSGLEMQALKQREFLEKLLASMREVVVITDHAGMITYASPRLPANSVGKSFFDLANPVSTYTGIWGAHYLEVSREPVEVVMLTGDGDLKPLELIITPLEPTLGGNRSYLVVGRDLSVIRRLEEKLKRQAIYDGLTQLYNHDYFHTLLTHEMKRSKRIDRGSTAIIFIDLDSFKSINDEMGHQAGDDALRKVAAAIRHNVRAGMDYPCRYGGDEFAVILTEIEKEDLKGLVSRLIKGINVCWKQHISCSIGVALSKPDEQATRLLSRADKASYKAKTSGGNRIIFAE